MEWRKKRVKDSEPETDACRIPQKMPRKGLVSSAVRVEKPPSEYGPSELNAIIALVICIMLLLLTPLWNLTYVVPASVSFRNSSDIQGQNGFHLRTENWEGSQDVVILNSTPFPGPPEWNTYTLYTTDIVGEMRSDGYYIDFQGSPFSKQQVFFARRLHIALDDYSTSNFEARVSVISGSVNATLRVAFGDYRWGNLVVKEDIESIQAGADTTLIVEAPLALLRTISEQWIVKANVYITLESFTGAIVVINEFNARATGNVPLYPLVIDLRSTTNESLYDNPFTRFLMTPPYLVVSREGTLGNSTVWPEEANETLFVAEGNYTADVGWVCHDSYPDPFDLQRLEFSISPSMKTFLEVKMKAVRLSLVGFELTPFERFEITYDSSGDWDDEQYYFWDYYEPPRAFPDYVYLAPLSGQLTFHGRTADTLQNDPLTGYYGGTFNLEGIIMTDGTHHLELAITLPVIPVGSMYLGLGHFLIIIITGFLMFLVYRKYREVNTLEDSRMLLRNPRIIPVILLIAGAITPWYANTNYLNGSIDANVTMYYFVPIIIEAIVAADFSILLTIPFGWYFVLLLAGILYWYPLTKISVSMIAPQSSEKEQHSLRYLGMIAVLCVMTLILSILAGIRPVIGVGLALSALLVWIIQDALQRMREGDSKLEKKTAEGKENE